MTDGVILGRLSVASANIALIGSLGFLPNIKKNGEYPVAEFRVLFYACVILLRASFQFDFSLSDNVLSIPIIVLLKRSV